MKHLTLEEFINTLTEEDLWKIIDEYENIPAPDYEIEARFTREKAKEFCDRYYYMEYMQKIALHAYRYFALKYKEMIK